MNSSQYLAWIEQSAAALSAAQDELTALRRVAKLGETT